MALAEAGLALLYRGDEPYRLSYPHDRDLPDRSTCVEFGPAVLEEAFGRERLARDLGAPLSPRTQLLNFAVMSALRPGAGDRLASEEMSLAGTARVDGVASADALKTSFRISFRARPDQRPNLVALRLRERARSALVAAGVPLG